MNDDSALQPSGNAHRAIELAQDRPTVPFSVDLGTSTIQGILTLDAAAVRVDWRRYNLFDEPKGGMQTVTIDYRGISAIEIRNRFYGTRITIACKSPAYLQDLPLPSGTLNEMVCSVQRRRRQQAELWVAEATLRLVELD